MDYTSPNKKRRISYDTPSVAPEKRRRVVSTTRGRKSTKAAMILEIPLEIVHEILSYLEPYDILRLARTSKNVRRLLTSRTSGFMWRRARLNADNVPPLPADLSEPAYANLLFYTNCSFCEGRGARPIWECRVRCCKKCFQNKFIPEMSLSTSYYSLLHKHRLMSVIPKANTEFRRGAHLYIEALDQYNAELSSIEDDVEAIEQWISHKIEQYNTTKNHSRDCAAWEIGRKDRQTMERWNARQDRIKWIDERATGEGWGVEVQSFRSLRGFPVGKWVSNHASINRKAKSALTDVEWAKIKPMILQSLHSQRETLTREAMRRRLHLLQEAFDQHYSQTLLLHNIVFPSLGDLVTTDGPIKRLIEETPLDRTPPWFNPISDNTSFFSEIFPYSPVFSEFIRKWRFEKEMELFRILCKAVPTTSDGSALCLATTVFKCNASGCGEALYYPEVFWHSCATAYDFTPDVAASASDLTWPLEGISDSSLVGTIHVAGDTFDGCKMLKTKWWNAGGNRISFHHRASDIARRLLDNDTHLDASKTTIQQIRTWNPIICCKTCSWRRLYWTDLLRHEDVEIHDCVIQWPTSDQQTDGFGLSNSWVYASRCGFCDILLHPNALYAHLLSQHRCSKLDGYWYMDFHNRLPV
ncbi:hypothetical protein BDP27DRAFT_1321061 [Rhodocollybia butyracea]|uniref:F-box domain-containing protein n=1 Tax=Rhodocollybia butyracea TaxID=206335 RepID=A0A9P5UAK3_9AGAR|nr:hypothetical protein BDP27DRAFT_1321061 [Rhodocollybia butyracea]